MQEPKRNDDERVLEAEEIINEWCASPQSLNDLVRDEKGQPKKEYEKGLRTLIDRGHVAVDVYGRYTLTDTFIVDL